MCADHEDSITKSLKLENLFHSQRLKGKLDIREIGSEWYFRGDTLNRYICLPHPPLSVVLFGETRAQNLII